MSDLMQFRCSVCGDIFFRRTIETGPAFCSGVCRYAPPGEALGLRQRAGRVRLEAKALRRVIEREIALMSKEEADR